MTTRTIYTGPADGWLKANLAPVPGAGVKP